MDTLGPRRQWDLVATTKTTPRTTQELLVLVKVTQSEVSLVLRHHILLNNLVVVILHSNLVVILPNNLVAILLNRLVDMEDPRVVIQVGLFNPNQGHVVKNDQSIMIAETLLTLIPSFGSGFLSFLESSKSDLVKFGLNSPRWRSYVSTKQSPFRSRGILYELKLKIALTDFTALD